MPQTDLPPPIRDPVVDASRRMTPTWQAHMAREPTIQVEDGATPQGTPRNGTLRVAGDGSALFVRVGDAWFKVNLVPA